MNIATRLFASTALASLAVSVGAAPASSIDAPEALVDTGVPVGDQYGAISADGSIIVGTRLLNDDLGSPRAFMWTSATGVENLGGLPDGGYFDVSYATDISADGGYVSGYAAASAIGSSSVGTVAYRWSEAGGFEDLGTLGGLGSQAWGISGDGTVVVGSSTNAQGKSRAMRWSEAGGMEELGTLPDEGSGIAYATSGDGSVVVGVSTASVNYLLTPRAFVWNATEGMKALEMLGDGTQSYANDISDDGTIIVGQSLGTSYGSRAVKWTDNGVEDLGVLSGGGSSRALGISRNGAVVVGESAAIEGGTYIGRRGFRWTEDGGMISVEDWLRNSGATIASDITAIALAANEDGSVIMGVTTAPDYNSRGSLYIARGMGTQPSTGGNTGGDTGNTGGDPGNTGGDTGNTGGDTGNTGGDPGNTGGDTGNTGGDTGNTGGDTGNTGGDTGNTGGDTGNTGGDTGNTGGDTGNTGGDTGNTGGDTGNTGGDTGNIDGNNGHTPGYIDLTGPNAPTTVTVPAAGIITIADFSVSIAATNTTTLLDYQKLALLLNGAGSRPLDRRAAGGKSLFWTGGDIGLSDHGGNDGDFLLGEIGAGHNFGGGFQLNGVIGATGSDNTGYLGSKSEFDAVYVKAEAMARLYGDDNRGLWAIAGVAGIWGDADMTRNYIVGGGAISSSTGSTNVSGYGLRGRLEYENLFPFVSPYGELSYTSACFDSYTETGGAFPVAFNDICNHTTELRYGFDAKVPVNDHFSVIGTLEGIHRFESASSGVSGTMIGVGGFNFAGTSYKQDWIRAGVGFEADIGPSTLSVMGNGTTSSDNASAWLAANWRVKF